MTYTEQQLSAELNELSTTDKGPSSDHPTDANISNDDSKWSKTEIAATAAGGVALAAAAAGGVYAYTKANDSVESKEGPFQSDSQQSSPYGEHCLVRPNDFSRQ